MLTALRTNLRECEHPVGVKKTSNWKLPPKDFAYGLPGKKDEEGVSISNHIHLITISYKKLESTSTIKDSSTSSGLHYY